MMKINEEMITCKICEEIFNEPVECCFCHNNFCKSCIEELKEICNRNGNAFNCPLCKTPLENNYQKNVQLELILNQMEFVCKICKKTINGINDYREHKKNCKFFYKCKICELKFISEEKFLKHLDINSSHIKIITNNFDKTNQNINWKEDFKVDIKRIKTQNEADINYQNFLEKEKIRDKNKEDEKRRYKLFNDDDEEKNFDNNEIYSYLNAKEIYEFQNYLNIKSEENFDKIFKIYFLGDKKFADFEKTEEFRNVCQIENNPSYVIPFNTFEIPEKCRFSEKYNLYFCYKNNGLNCDCCQNHICEPGNCLCKDCMKTNLSYHGLKKYYLINKAGRACKFSWGNFYCHCRTQNRSTNDNGNVFISNNWCHYNNPPCKACEETTKLMEKYLDPKLVSKLRFAKG